MAGQTILREYLLSLGFKVDTTGQRKFDNVLAKTGKGAALAGLSIGGLAATIAAMAEQYANAMEKMYYASRRGGGTVSQLQAMEYAGERVGLAAGTMTAAVTNMAAKMRMNPGLIGLLSGKLGIQTKGRTPVQEMMDLIDKTASMEYRKGASIAALFGLDEATYQVIRQNRVKIRADMEEREAMNKAGKADPDADAKALMEWDNQVLKVKASFTMLEGALTTKLLPVMRQITDETEKTLAGLQKDLTAAEGFWDFVFKRGDRAAKEGSSAGLPWDTSGDTTVDITPSSIKEGAKTAYDAIRRWALNKNRPGSADAIMGPAGGGGGGAAASSESSGHGFASQAERFAAIEKMWNLTPGTLQTLRNLESADGKNMGSGKKNAKGLGGIIGDFQMDPDARNHYGVINQFDEADAAGEMFHDLKKRFGSDAAAAAAWNGGTGAGKRGVDYAVNPDETRKFVPAFMKGINQTVNITVNGGGTGVVGAVKQGLAEANGDLVRNMKTVVQ